MKPISVLLVDDNPTFLRATTQFIKAHDDMTVVGTARQGELALAQISELQPQVILVDLAMISMPGLEVIPRLRSLMPQVGIIALTLLDADNFRQAALNAGADDFVPKATMRTDLIPTIRRVARGDVAESAKVAPPTKTQSDTNSTRLILIVEGNSDLCHVYSKVLRQAGYEVHTANTIQRASDLLDSTRFDVLLCAIHIGHDLGTDLLREHAATLAISGTLVVIVSSQAQYRGVCEELGADAFLEKPVAIDTLVALLERLTARQSFAGQ